MKKINSEPHPNEQLLTTFEEGILSLVKKLKCSRYGKSDHLPFLEPEIEYQLQLIQEKLMTHEQNFLFSKFEEEFKNRKENHTISYEWWIAFAYRLSILVTQKQFRSVSYSDEHNYITETLLKNNLWHTHTDFINLLRDDKYNSCIQLLDMFPEVVLVPTTLGDVSVRFLNRALSYNAMPLGMVTNSTIEDGQLFYPDRFFRHDLVHASNWFGSGFNTNTAHLFIEFILNQIDLQLNKREKTQLEFMLFFITHELVGVFPHINIENFDKLIGLHKTEDSFLHLCLDDGWYALLLQGYIGEIQDRNKQILEYSMGSIALIKKYISAFFEQYKITNLSEPVKIKQQYDMKYPLSETAILKHWTATNIHYKKFTQFSSSEFFHWLVTNDKSGPTDTSHSFLSTHIHLEKMHREYKESKNILQLSKYNLFVQHINKSTNIVSLPKKLITNISSFTDRLAYRNLMRTCSLFKSYEDNTVYKRLAAPAINFKYFSNPSLSEKNKIRLTHTKGGNYIQAVLQLSNGLLITANDSQLCIWQLATGSLLSTFELEDRSILKFIEIKPNIVAFIQIPSSIAFYDLNNPSKIIKLAEIVWPEGECILNNCTILCSPDHITAVTRVFAKSDDQGFYSRSSLHLKSIRFNPESIEDSNLSMTKLFTCEDWPNRCLALDSEKILFVYDDKMSIYDLSNGNKNKATPIKCIPFPKGKKSPYAMKLNNNQILTQFNKKSENSDNVVLDIWDLSKEPGLERIKTIPLFTLEINTFIETSGVFTIFQKIDGKLLILPDYGLYKNKEEMQVLIIDLEKKYGGELIDKFNLKLSLGCVTYKRSHFIEDGRYLLLPDSGSGWIDYIQFPLVKKEKEDICELRIHSSK